MRTPHRARHIDRREQRALRAAVCDEQEGACRNPATSAQLDRMLACPKRRCPLIDEEQRPRRSLEKHRMLLSPVCARVCNDRVEVSHCRIEQRRQFVHYRFGLLESSRCSDKAEPLLVARQIGQGNSTGKHLVNPLSTLGPKQFAHIPELEVAIEKQRLDSRRS